MALRRAGVVPPDSFRSLNAWLIWIALPASTLLFVPSMNFTPELALLVMSPLVTWAGAWLMSIPLAGHLGLTARSRAAWLLCAGLSNTSFVGFPVSEAFYGKEALKYAVVCDQVSFILVSTLGVAVGLAAATGARPRPGVLLQGLFRFPPFLAFLLAFGLGSRLLEPPWPDFFAKFQATLVPLALFSIGIQLKANPAEARGIELWAGLLYKLVLAPALVLAVGLALGGHGLLLKEAVLESAMASMTVTSIVAAQYGLDTRLVNLMIGLGIPLSLLSAGLWFQILSRFA